MAWRLTAPSLSSTGVNLLSVSLGDTFNEMTMEVQKICIQQNEIHGTICYLVKTSVSWLSSQNQYA